MLTVWQNRDRKRKKIDWLSSFYWHRNRVKKTHKISNKIEVSVTIHINSWTFSLNQRLLKKQSKTLKNSREKTTSSQLHRKNLLRVSKYIEQKSKNMRFYFSKNFSVYKNQ